MRLDLMTNDDVLLAAWIHPQGGVVALYFENPDAKGNMKKHTGGTFSSIGSFLERATAFGMSQASISEEAVRNQHDSSFGFQIWMVKKSNDLLTALGFNEVGARL
jgi:hypothetical protein